MRRKDPAPCHLDVRPQAASAILMMAVITALVSSSRVMAAAPSLVASNKRYHRRLLPPRRGGDVGLKVRGGGGGGGGYHQDYDYYQQEEGDDYSASANPYTSTPGGYYPNDNTNDYYEYDDGSGGGDWSHQAAYQQQQQPPPQPQQQQQQQAPPTAAAAQEALPEVVPNTFGSGSTTIIETEQERVERWKQQQREQAMLTAQNIPNTGQEASGSLLATVSKGSRIVIFFFLMWRDIHLFEMADQAFAVKSGGSASSSSNSAWRVCLVTPLVFLFVANLGGAIASMASNLSQASKRRLKAILNADKMVETGLLVYYLLRLTVAPSKYTAREVYIANIFHSLLFLLQCHAFTRVSWNDKNAPEFAKLSQPSAEGSDAAAGEGGEANDDDEDYYYQQPGGEPLFAYDNNYEEDYYQPYQQQQQQQRPMASSSSGTAPPPYNQNTGRGQ